MPTEKRERIRALRENIAKATKSIETLRADREKWQAELKQLKAEAEEVQENETAAI